MIMIGIFDSGIGGVTVLKELLNFLPNEKYIYYSDSKNSPYGDKSEEELKKLTSNVISFLIDKGANIIVIACNTASTLSSYLREKFDIPIVAIEPAYKMVYDYAYDKKVLVMATKRTLESDKFNKLYQKYNNNNTILLPCSGLADLIEEGNERKIDDYLSQNISKYKGVECVVLGCTHYPLIKINLTKVLGNVEFFDGSYGVSKMVYEKYKNNINSDKSNFNIEFIDSSNSDSKRERFFKILNAK